MASPSPNWPRRGLYLITPELADTAELCERTERALRGGAVLLQYRHKQADTVLRREQAMALQALCAAFDVPLIINDDVELASAIGAAGVHLGASDGNLARARARLGPAAILGASCYDDLARARAAVDAGVSYLAFGAFHPSPTKPLARRADPALLRAAASWGLPLVAIGGITPDNARPLIDAGADLVAVISAVFDAPDIEAAARRHARLFQD
jgi:thiamine-phosphate pyrophosphorylase